jgi:hypothetical protein
MSDGDEVAVGRDPLDPNDGVQILVIERSIEDADWTAVTWKGPSSATYEIRWTDDPPGGTRTWDVVNGPALGDIADNGDGTWTWTDKGTDPDMGGLAPGDVPARWYVIVLYPSGPTANPS